MSNSLLRVQVRMQQAWYSFRENERGQAMVEYVGIAFIVLALVGVVIGAMSSQGKDIASTIADKVKEAIDGVG
ncbi:MAG: hypothetical protein Q4C85_04295 [Actinomyces sp.]|uniref:Flp family type IVb pilin n=1 Tax=Actinomyces sp. TaxID=29317 RepID=UPI0026DA98A4|nr:hypothetical protein [Actinomyces sp.]MDO4242969.1 hypothetical protein [Actinomyces sp.]